MPPCQASGIDEAAPAAECSSERERESEGSVYDEDLEMLLQHVAAGRTTRTGRQMAPPAWMNE